MAQFARCINSYAILGDKSPDGFELQSNGKWRFDPTHPSYKALRQGEFRSLFVPIVVSDEMGGMTVARLQITVNGTQP